MADPVLSQDEVDALLNGMDSGAVSTEPAPAPDQFRTYDLGKEARIVRGRMPTLEMMNDRFGRLFRNSLYTLLRRSAVISVEAVRTFKFGEYVHRLHVPTSLNIVRYTPLRGSGLVVVSPQLVFAVVDTFFGGKGRHAKIEGREFTATENRIIQMLLDAVFSDLSEAWSNVLPIRPEYVARETNPQFANIVSPTEIVVVNAFKIDLEGVGGELHVTVPYAALEPYREVLDAGVQSDRNAVDSRWRESLREEIEDADIDLTTLVGRATVSLGDLLNLKPGDIVPCDFNGMVTVYAEDVPIFRGGFGHSRGQQAVRVDQFVNRPRYGADPARSHS